MAEALINSTNIERRFLRVLAFPGRVELKAKNEAVPGEAQKANQIALIVVF
jgi:hypothetical protein